MELYKGDANKKRVYPFVNKIVDTLYESTEVLLKNHIDDESEKGIFMMFIVMYYIIHLKTSNDSINQKTDIKETLSDILRDSEKRTMCLRMFESTFRQIFTCGSKSLKL